MLCFLLLVMGHADLVLVLGFLSHFLKHIFWSILQLLGSLLRRQGGATAPRRPAERKTSPTSECPGEAHPTELSWERRSQSREHPALHIPHQTKWRNQMQPASRSLASSRTCQQNSGTQRRRRDHVWDESANILLLDRQRSCATAPQHAELA